MDRHLGRDEPRNQPDQSLSARRQASVAVVYSRHAPRGSVVHWRDAFVRGLSRARLERPNLIWRAGGLHRVDAVDLSGEFHSIDWSGDRHGVARVESVGNERMNGRVRRLTGMFFILALQMCT